MSRDDTSQTICYCCLWTTLCLISCTSPSLFLQVLYFRVDNLEPDQHSPNRSTLRLVQSFNVYHCETRQDQWHEWSTQFDGSFCPVTIASLRGTLRELLVQCIGFSLHVVQQKNEMSQKRKGVAQTKPLNIGHSEYQKTSTSIGYKIPYQRWLLPRQFQ